MEVIWVETADLQFNHVGHGLLFGAKEPESSADFLAVVRGFGWLHGRPDEVIVEMVPIDDLLSADQLAAFRLDIENLLQEPSRLTTTRGWVTPRLYVHGNT